MLNISLQVIPFKEGPTSMIMSVVCILFSLIAFLSFSFHNFFAVPTRTLMESDKPGFVIEIPESILNADLPIPKTSSSPNNPAIADNGTEKGDAMSFLSHILSYMDEVTSSKEFLLQDVFPALGSFGTSSKEAGTKETVFVDVRVDTGLLGTTNSSNTPLQTYVGQPYASLHQNLKKDIEGLLPGALVHDRRLFFKSQFSLIEGYASTAFTTGIVAFLSLLLSVGILLSDLYDSKAKTLQTLRFMGATRKDIKSVFMVFMGQKIGKGIFIGMIAACVTFLPFAITLDPSTSTVMIFTQELVTSLMLAGLGFMVAYALSHTFLGMKSKALF